MSSKNCYETFGFVPNVQSAEKLLREHELETTTSFVMYYNYGVGKGKSPVRGPGGGGMGGFRIDWYISSLNEEDEAVVHM